MSQNLRVTIESDLLQVAMRKMVEKFPEAADAIIRKTAFDIVARVAETAPVDTGRYRAGWRASLTPLQGDGESDTVEVTTTEQGIQITVTNPVEYGPFIEYGTSTRPPGFQLSTAIETVRNALPVEVVGEEVKRIWNEST